ncbi:MAG: hypothetical protein RL341_1725 [Pseudomonadota bacterium]
MADLQDALAAHHRPLAATTEQQSLYIAGAIGKFGEALIALAASQSRLAAVWVAVEQALPSTEAKVTPTFGKALPAGVDAAVLVLSDAAAGLTYYGRDAIYSRVTATDLLARATALKAAGVRRLALVQPVDFWQQPESVRGLLASQDELAISLLGFEVLLVVRPPRQDDKPAAASRLQRVVDTYLRQFRWLAPARLPLTHRDVAGFVIERLLAGEPGVHVIEAGELEKLIYPARANNPLPRRERAG